MRLEFRRLRRWRGVLVFGGVAIAVILLSGWVTCNVAPLGWRWSVTVQRGLFLVEKRYQPLTAAEREFVDGWIFLESGASGGRLGPLCVPVWSRPAWFWGPRHRSSHWGWEAAVPLWWGAVGVVVPWSVVVWRRARRERGACGRCGYDLCGVVDGGVCPECGGGADVTVNS